MEILKVFPCMFAFFADFKILTAQRFGKEALDRDDCIEWIIEQIKR